LTPQSSHARFQNLDFIDVKTVTPAPIGVQILRRNKLRSSQPLGEVTMLSVHEVITQRFDEYAMALGKVVYTWNALHEQLGKLYAVVAGITPENGFKLWYSKRNDRWQRDQFREALKAANFNAVNTKANADLLWLIDQTDLLAEDRNDAVHAPCGMLINNKFEITANYFNGNPRAANLRDKPILLHFAWYERRAITLSNYTEHAFISIMHYKGKWPDRPAMPTLKA
jgi:hypothetical protein